MTKRPDVLVSKITDLFDPDIYEYEQGVCTTAEDNAWTWVLRMGPEKKQVFLTLLLNPKVPDTYVANLSIGGTMIWKEGCARNNTKYAKVLSLSLRKVRMAAPARH
jgi:hypothetical protein